MARVIMTILGVGLLALGGWLTFCVWPGAVLTVLAGCLALFVLVAGIAVTVFGISEMAGARSAKGEAGKKDESDSHASGESRKQ